MRTQRWQDWANMVLGFALVLSPLFVQFGTWPSIAAWNACLLGFAIIVLAGSASYMPSSWEGLNLALGLWLVISPLVLGFSASKLLATTTVTVGILVTALATSALLREIRLRQWWHQHHGPRPHHGAS